MTKWIALGVVLLFGLSGCMVSKTKYEDTVSDMESAKAELEKSRMHQQALEEQIRNLKSLNEKISTDLEVMTTEVQRIKEGRQNEQTLMETREREIDQEKEKLSMKLRVISAQYQKVKAQNKTLKNTVLRYKKELKDSRGSAVDSTRPVMKSSTKRAVKSPKSSMAKSSPVSTLSTPKVSKPIASPVKTKLSNTLVNINNASVSDLVLNLGLSRDLAEDVVSHRPYRLRGELVAKNVITKAKFDEIKSRITAAP